MPTIRNFAAWCNTEQSVKTVTNVPGPKCYQRARLQTSQARLPFNLVSNHAYMFEKLSVTDGVAMVQLGNPWGSYQPSAIPFAQLSRAFVEIDIGRFS